MALHTRTIHAALIHHSDQGVQYAAADYVAMLQEHKIEISMSRTRNPYDNAKAERFMRTLKYEEIYMNDYETRRRARLDRTFHRSSLQSQATSFLDRLSTAGRV